MIGVCQDTQGREFQSYGVTTEKILSQVSINYTSVREALQLLIQDDVRLMWKKVVL